MKEAKKTYPLWSPQNMRNAVNYQKIGDGGDIYSK
jgi:hypothetical protein